MSMAEPPPPPPPPPFPVAMSTPLPPTPVAMSREPLPFPLLLPLLLQPKENKTIEREIGINVCRMGRPPSFGVATRANAKPATVVRKYPDPLIAPCLGLPFPVQFTHMYVAKRNGSCDGQRIDSRCLRARLCAPTGRDRDGKNAL